MNSLLSNLNEGAKEDIIIQNENIICQITTTEIQKNKKNKNNNESTIDLGECEKTLRQIYDLNDSIPLIIFKVDYIKHDLLIPIIGYEVFHPENKSKLNLNYCKDNSNNINVIIPVNIDENNFFKYDPNSDYYTDQCNPYTTDNGTDIIINDRQIEYNDNNMALCENTCELSEYEYDTKKVICECIIKVKQIEVSEVENQTDLLYHNFTSIDESSNMAIMKCYYILFSKEGLLYNIGNYILLFTVIFFITSSILFYKCGYLLIERMIKVRTKSTKKNKQKKNLRGTINIYNGKKIKSKSKRKKKENEKPILKIKIKNKNPKSNKKIKFRKKNANKNKSIKKGDSIYNKSISKLKKSYNDILSPIKKNKKKLKNQKFKQKIKEIKNIYTDYELNTMTYELAIKNDKRTFSQYYISLIMKKHPILFSFFFTKDFNLNIIKLNLFFLSFSIYYFINALFFDESIIHQIYKDAGIYNIPCSPMTLQYNLFLFSHK